MKRRIRFEAGYDEGGGRTHDVVKSAVHRASCPDNIVTLCSNQGGCSRLNTLPPHSCAEIYQQSNVAKR